MSSASDEEQTCEHKTEVPHNYLLQLQGERWRANTGNRLSLKGAVVKMKDFALGFLIFRV